MKIAMLAALLAAFYGAHAQTLTFQDPPPDKLRVEQLTDAELESLNRLSDARQKALKDYFDARDAYNSEKAKLAEKYNAKESVESACGGAHMDVEWKGRYIIIEQYPQSSSSCLYTNPAIGAYLGKGSDLVIASH